MSAHRTSDPFVGRLHPLSRAAAPRLLLRRWDGVLTWAMLGLCVLLLVSATGCSGNVRQAGAWKSSSLRT
jgi:hypothetical protein